MTWKDLRVGNKFVYIVDDFDGYSEEVCTVVSVHDDHLLASCEYTDHLWIDGDSTIKIYFDTQKAYDNGIESLAFGGTIIENELFREKDVLEDDYSVPILTGKNEILKIKEIDTSFNGLVYQVKFKNCKLILTEAELYAGI